MPKKLVSLLMIVFFTCAANPLFAQPVPFKEKIFGKNSCNNLVTCLQATMQNTFFALQKLNRMPTALRNLSLMALSLNKPDNSEQTAEMQNYFAKYGNAVLTLIKDQREFQETTYVDFFAHGDNTLMQPKDNPKILETLMNANDLAYESILGKPPFPKAKEVDKAPYNYFKNASGLTIPHVMPGNWSGPQPDNDRYKAYYNSTMAIQSYNGYMLSKLLVENQKKSVANKMQQKLMNLASTSTWFSKIATQELGKVLRQNLMFQSQSYLLLSELVQTQRQLLYAQLMTNTLLIINNNNTEGVLVARAQGVSK